jgi:catechol O-methyltransferase
MADDRRQAALAHVRAQAKEGDVPSILAAFDDFARTQDFLMNVGPEKGPMLAEKVQQLPQGAKVLELGCFCGYSAVLIGAALPTGASLTGIEVDEESVAVARSVVEFAGLSDSIEIRHGASADVIPALEGPLDLVFLDHWKDLYKADLIALEQAELLRPGSVIFADNVGPHFNPEEYLEYVRDGGHYDSTYHQSHIEYREEEDGVEISVYRG